MDMNGLMIAVREIKETYLEGILPERSSEGVGLPHLAWMCEVMLAGGMSENKAMRWLGYLQGVLVADWHATLSEMKDVSERAYAASKPRLIRHVKRNSVYEVAGTGSFQTSRTLAGIPKRRVLDDQDEVIIYRGKDSGLLFVRCPDEFGDGRFVDLKEDGS